jgi:hypothetical protein
MCSYKHELQINGREETTNCAAACKFSITQANVQCKSKSKEQTVPIHMKNISRTQKRMIQRQRGFMEWKTWSTATLIK